MRSAVDELSALTYKMTEHLYAELGGETPNSAPGSAPPGRRPPVAVTAIGASRALTLSKRDYYEVLERSSRSSTTPS